MSRVRCHEFHIDQEVLSVWRGAQANPTRRQTAATANGGDARATDLFPQHAVSYCYTRRRVFWTDRGGARAGDSRRGAWRPGAHWYASGDTATENGRRKADGGR